MYKNRALIDQIVTVSMKYSAVILLALLGIAVASTLHQQDASKFETHVNDIFRRHRNWNNDDDMNDNNNNSNRWNKHRRNDNQKNNDNDWDNRSDNDWDNRSTDINRKNRDNDWDNRSDNDWDNRGTDINRKNRDNDWDNRSDNDWDNRSTDINRKNRDNDWDNRSDNDWDNRSTDINRKNRDNDWDNRSDNDWDNRSTDINRKNQDNDWDNRSDNDWDNRSTDINRRNRGNDWDNRSDNDWDNRSDNSWNDRKNNDDWNNRRNNDNCNNHRNKHDNNDCNNHRNNDNDWDDNHWNNTEDIYQNLNINLDDKVLLQKQKVILQLLSNLQGKITNENLAQLGNNFNPVKNINKFNNQLAVEKFLKNVKNNNFLPKDEVFSSSNQQHQNQAAQLFTFLISARDWNTLKQAAVWARNRFNTEQFAFALSSTVVNHPTTQGVVIPALYEIIPHAFVPATTLNKIFKAKLQGIDGITVRATYTNQNRNNKDYNLDNNDKYNNRVNIQIGTHNPNNVFADNDGSINNNAGTAENPENRISYFTEDVGINDIHARFHIQYPVFFGENNNKNYYTSNLDNPNKIDTINTNNQDVKRGENFYFAHQQLYARYVLERLSNNLPIPHPINLQDKIETGYNPNLLYTNGQQVPARPPKTLFYQQHIEGNNNNNNALLPNNNQAQNTKVLEQRLQQVAESGVLFKEDGTLIKLNIKNGLGILANLIAAPASSLNPDYYGDFYSTAKNSIGNIVDTNNQNKVAPGVVSNYVTAARDPAYYQLLAKINIMFKNLQNKQGPYTKDQLAFPGVKVENIDVSNLMTEFQTFTINVNNALPKNINNNKYYVNNGNNDIGNYNVKFQRLINKPFTVKMTVLSEKNTNAIVRIFLGPKYDSNGQRFTLPQASQYFVQLDQFKVKLNNGQNVIRRNSQQSNVNVYNPANIKQLWNRVEQGKVVIKKSEHQVLGLPLYSQLPKGKRDGQQFILYTIVNALDNNDNIENDITNIDSLEINDYLNRDRHHNVDNTVNGRTYNKNTINHQILKTVRDNRSVGFPLDRPVNDVNYNTANQYFKTVTIYHRVNNDN